MSLAVYVLCAVTSLGCAALLARSWLRGRARIVLYTTCCFILLAVANIVLVVDLVVLPASVDLSAVRTSTALAGLLVLLFGLIWEEKR